MGLDFFQNFQMPTLNDEDQACLTSCMDEIRNVVGESVSERQLVDTIMKFKFDFAKSLDAILNASTTPPTKSTRLPAVTTSIAPTIETGDTQHLIAIDIWKQHAICIPNEMVHLFWFSFFFSCFFFLFRFCSISLDTDGRTKISNSIPFVSCAASSSYAR